MGKTWLIASGKGGVGKSTLAACLGIAFTRLGSRVCIVDADIGLRDQDAILGQENRVVYDLVDVCNRSCRLQQALINPEQYPCLSLLPASQFARCKELKASAFASTMEKLRAMYDIVLIDGPAGIEKGLRNTLKANLHGAIILCTPDDVCIRNAERVTQLFQATELPRPKLIVNRLDSNLIRIHEMYAAQVVAQTLDLELLGEIPDDPMIYRSLINHCTPMDIPCGAQDAFMRIAKRMRGEEIKLPAFGTEAVPWYKRMFQRKLPKIAFKEVSHIDC